MEELMATNKQNILENFIYTFFNNDPSVNKDRLERMFNPSNSQILLLDGPTFEEEMQLVLETVRLNLESASKFKAATSEAKYKAFYSAIEAFNRHVAENAELAKNIELNHKRFAGKTTTSGTDEEAEIEEHIVCFDDEQPFAHRIRQGAFKQPLKCGNSPLPEGQIASLTSYEFERFLSVSDKELTAGALKVLRQAEATFAECLQANGFGLFEEESVPVMQSLVIVARVVLRPEDLATLNYTFVTLEYLLKGDHIATTQANFSQLGEVFLFNNQALVLRGEFNQNRAVFCPKAVLSIFREFEQAKAGWLPPLQKSDFQANVLLVKGPFYQPLYQGKTMNHKRQEEENFYRITPDFDSIFSKLQQLVKRSSANCLVVIGPVVPRSLALTNFEFEESFELLFQRFLRQLDLVEVPHKFFVVDFEEMANYFPVPVEPSLATMGSVKVLPNPGVLQLGPLTLGFSNTNLLQEFRAQTLLRPKELSAEEWLDKTLKQILMSKNLHPIFPHSKPYDLSQFDRFSVAEFPRVFVTNANGLDEFVRVEQGEANVLNLHSFVKKTGYGSYALVGFDGRAEKKISIEVFNTHASD